MQYMRESLIERCLILTEDLIYGIVTISPAHKGNGEKYIFEIVDCLNKTEQI